MVQTAMLHDTILLVGHGQAPLSLPFWVIAATMFIVWVLRS